MNKKGVSTVIGVLLMVGVTIGMIAILGSFVIDYRGENTDIQSADIAVDVDNDNMTVTVISTNSNTKNIIVEKPNGTEKSITLNKDGTASSSISLQGNGTYLVKTVGSNGLEQVQKSVRIGSINNNNDNNGGDEGTTISGTIEDFEDTSLSSEWSTDSNAKIVDNRSQSGSKSLYSNKRTSGITAEFSPDELDGGKEISNLEFYWNEKQSSYGTAWTPVDSSGNPIFRVATDNNEWEYNDGGRWTQFYGGDGYDRWIRVTINFDWQNEESTVTYKDLQSGTSKTVTVNHISSSGGMEKFTVRTFASGSINNDVIGMYAWTDNISIQN